MNRLSCIFVFALGIISIGPIANAQPAQIPEELNLDELVEIAERFEFPQPPQDAKLVLAFTNSWTVIGNSSTDRDPGIYHPAFLLETLSDGSARVLMGYDTVVTKASDDHVPAIRPFTLKSPKPKVGGFDAQYNNLSSFATCVQLARRGDRQQAQELWTVIASSEYFDNGAMWDSLGAMRADPPSLLALAIYRYYEQSTMSPGVNFTTVHRQLTQLKEEFPSLFSTVTTDFDKFYRHQFLLDLELTLQPLENQTNSVEGLLIEWGNKSTEYRRRSYLNKPSESSVTPVAEILRMGVQAIPDLVELVDNRRLIQMDTGESPRRRVGGLARALLKDMTGVLAPQDNDWRAWMQSTDLSDESDFFAKASFHYVRNKIKNTYPVPLWILGQKHPQALRKLADEFCENARRSMNPFDLCRAIGYSTLQPSEITSVLSSLVGRLPREGKRAALQVLAEVDSAECIKLLRPILETFPADVKEPYWTSETANYTHVIMQLNDDSIWRDYLAAAQQARVGLRMEMMNPMNYTYIGDKNLNHRLAFLAAFLDDTETRIPRGSKYTGPFAAFTFRKITVRDFAAMKLASLLDLEDRPKNSWTKAQWDDLRKRVRTELSKHDLPNLPSASRSQERNLPRNALDKT